MPRELSSESSFIPGFAIPSCERCHRILYDEDSFQSCDYQHLCENCYQSSQRCFICEERFFDNETIENWGICSSCFSLNFIRCEECGNYFFVSEVINITIIRAFCYDCYHDNWFFCSDCNDYFERGNLCNCREEEEEDDDDDRNVIHQYGYKPHAIMHGDCRFRHFGIELEVDELSNPGSTAREIQQESERDYYLKQDGSLDNGFEIVTHPRTLQSWHEFYRTFNFTCSDVVSEGGKSHRTSTCGLHIHVDNNISQSEKIKIALLVYGNLDFFEKFGRRSFGHYCESKNIRYGKTNLDSSDSRYEAINFQNSHTVEFRFFRGTLKTSTVIASIEMVDAIMETVKQYSVMQIMKNGIDCLKNTISHGIFSGKYRWEYIGQYLQKRGIGL